MGELVSFKLSFDLLVLCDDFYCCARGCGLGVDGEFLLVDVDLFLFLSFINGSHGNV